MEEWQLQESPPRRSASFWFWLAAATLAAAFAAIALFKPAGTIGNSAANGKSLAALDLQPLSGAAAALGPKELEGRVSLVNFWGTWCPPCRLEFPHVVQLAEKFRSRREFQLLAVSCPADRDGKLAELREDTESFLRQNGFELPIYADPQAQTRLALQELIGASSFSYPTTVVLDREGIIRGMWVGYRPGDERDVEALVEKVLGK